MLVPLEWHLWLQEVPERPHFGHHCTVTAVTDLVDQSRPRVDVSYILWNWELMDCVEVSAAWFDRMRYYLEPRELHCISSKAEFLRVKGGAILPT